MRSTRSRRQPLLWKHTADWVAMWLMNGTAVTADAPVPPSGSGWNVALVGDFNGDGKTDILLEKRSSGTLAATVLWLMDGVTVSQAALLSYVWTAWDLKP